MIAHSLFILLKFLPAESLPWRIIFTYWDDAIHCGHWRKNQHHRWSKFT